jgi:hypothetical protein
MFDIGLATLLALGASSVAMATFALVECASPIGRRALRTLDLAFAVMTGKALGRCLMVLESDEPLFARGKKYFSSVGEIGVAIIAAQAL